MRRASRAWRWGLVLVGAALASTSCRDRPRPHVVLITVDTLRADALGFAGNVRAATPALDRLAAGGRVFDSAHAHAVTCAMAHLLAPGHSYYRRAKGDDR